MYFVMVLLLLLLLPAASVAESYLHSAHNAPVLFLVGKWYVFWAVGVRLFVAGLRQVIQPQFTAEEIFRLEDRSAFPLVREIGFANLSMGLLGICSLWRSGWIVPAAIVGGLYYGLAGVGHIPQNDKNSKEWVAMVSDGFVFVVLLVFVLQNGV
jgi:hypothetical protein